MPEKKVAIHFYGGAESVTGSNFMLETLVEEKKKILIDCGLFQGTTELEKQNHQPFPYNPAEIDALFVTHGHLDHIGRIPQLVKAGFRGPIYSTAPTKDIAAISFEDSYGIMLNELKEGEIALYDESDIKQALSQWQAFDYHDPITIGPVKVVLRDAGHILGSSMVEFNFANRRLVFTGDLGNPPTPLLKDTEKVTNADYMVIESVYGDRDHEGVEERRHRLEDTIEETMRRGGTLVIPAFSIERTQEILFEIELMMENSRIPLVPVFIDSPLAIKITDVYKKHSRFLNEKVRKMIESGEPIFHFPQLQMTMTTEQSKAIHRSNKRKIIIAGSGMSTGGRVIHHEKEFLPDPNSTLLLIGYQAVNSLGRVLQEGAKVVTILGEKVPVQARIENIGGYSAHRDGSGLLEFINDTSDTLHHLFVAMGEPKSSMTLAQRVRDYIGIHATVPKPGDKVELDW